MKETNSKEPLGAREFILKKYPHLLNPIEGYNPVIDFELMNLCEWFEEYAALYRKVYPAKDLPKSKYFVWSAKNGDTCILTKDGGRRIATFSSKTFSERNEISKILEDPESQLAEQSAIISSQKQALSELAGELREMQSELSQVKERAENLKAELENSEKAHDLTLDMLMATREKGHKMSDAIKEAGHDIGFMSLDPENRTALRSALNAWNQIK